MARCHRSDARLHTAIINKPEASSPPAGCRAHRSAQFSGPCRDDSAELAAASRGEHRRLSPFRRARSRRHDQLLSLFVVPVPKGCSSGNPSVHVAVAGEMYCGQLPARQRVSPRRCVARGHDVLPDAGLHPADPHRRTQTSAAPGVLRWLSVFLEQAGAAVPPHATRLRPAVGPPWVIRLASKPQIKVARSEEPWRDDRLHVAARVGSRPRRIAKLLGWLRTEPRFDVINLPICAAARPRARASPPRAEGADLLRVARRGPVLDGLRARVSQACDVVIRAAMAHVDAFLLPVSEYPTGDFHDRYLGIPREKMRLVPLGNQHGRVRWRSHAAQPAVHHRVFLARIAPGGGERPSRAFVRPTGSACSHARQIGPWLPQGIYRRRSTQPYLDENPSSDARMGTRGGIRLPGRGLTARRRRLSLQSLNVLRCRRRTSSPKDCFPARGHGQRRAGRARAAALSPKWCRRQVGGCIVEPDNPSGLATPG